VRSDGQAFDYAQIGLVGHSLGSVIAYDTLNQLLNDDETPGPTRPFWDVCARTCIFLTFGSPLDKTAFVFSTRRAERDTSDAREARASSVQPLINDVRYRAIPWINVFSHSDIISGHLKFYDVPLSGHARVENIVDRDALTFLGAHTEYWKNSEVFDRLHRALTA
jgi:hypothetical protein